MVNTKRVRCFRSTGNRQAKSKDGSTLLGPLEFWDEHPFIIYFGVQRVLRLFDPYGSLRQGINHRDKKKRKKRIGKKKASTTHEKLCHLVVETKRGFGWKKVVDSYFQKNPSIKTHIYIYISPIYIHISKKIQVSKPSFSLMWCRPPGLSPIPSARPRQRLPQRTRAVPGVLRRPWLRCSLTGLLWC